MLPIRLLALRERLEDLQARVEALADDFARRSGLPHKPASAEALEWLAQQAWPGNIRGLRNTLEQATLMTDDPVRPLAEQVAELERIAAQAARNSESKLDSGPSARRAGKRHRHNMKSKPTIVLVHGAWGGAWIWRRVLAPLRAAGHEVHAVTLTGDGERAHLRRPEITLQTHIDDLLGLVDAEELRELVLVGHSYGGMVITGAAAALQARGFGGLRHLVFVDAMVPLPGEGWGDAHPPQIVEARRAAAAAHDNALPPPDPADFGLEGADRAWLLRRQVPHPFGMYRVPLHFDGDALARLPRTFVDCNRPAYPTIDAMRARVRSQPGWRVVEIATGHCPMVSTPAELVAHLLAAARG